MRLIPPAAIDRFGDKPPRDKFDPSDYIGGSDGGIF
jgi:hypothetical protein